MGVVITAGRSRHRTNTAAEGQLAMATDTVKLRERVTDRQKGRGGRQRQRETKREEGDGVETDRQTDGQTERLDQNTKKKQNKKKQEALLTGGRGEGKGGIE